MMVATWLSELLGKITNSILFHEQWYQGQSTFSDIMQIHADILVLLSDIAMSKRFRML